MAKKNKIKFEFGIDFQELILKYTVTDKKGYKVLPLYDDTYFDLIEHATIANALKKYYKSRKRIPEKALLKETLRTLYENQKRTYSGLTQDDKKRINDLIDSLYSSTVPDGETILEKCKNFAQFVQFKTKLEEIDVNNYTSYETAVNDLRKAINIGNELEDSFGTFVVGGMKDRAHKRDIEHLVKPTPFWQFNKLLNSGGFTEASMILLASQAKRFKTGFLINVCKFYLRRKRKILYIDLENGEGALTMRTEQSLTNSAQDIIASGDLDDKLVKLMRKYKRIGAELVIKRFPAYLTTCNDIQKYMDKIKLETGIAFDLGIIDYGDLLGANSGVTDEVKRISDAYIDMKNLASYNHWECIWTASHVKNDKDTVKRKATKYTQNDLAKCSDKIRHVDVALGLQESEEEEANGVIRVEVIEQRNGMREGKMLFWADIEKQTLKEFTKAEVQNYWDQLGEDSPEDKKEFREQKQKHKEKVSDV